jgi:hypothetical protein
MNADDLIYTGLKSYMATVPEIKHREFTKLLPPKEQEKIKLAPQADLGDIFAFSPGIFLEKVHYTWFLIKIEAFSLKDQAIILDCLRYQKEDLKTALNLHSTVHDVTAFCKKFISSYFYDFLLSFCKEAVPLYALTKDPFYFLTQQSAGALDRLIFNLSLFDLKDEIALVIDKEKLKKLKSCFSENQWLFLQKLQSTQKELLFAPIGLSFWDGDVNKLKLLLKKRGLNRLSKTYIEAHPALKWHIMYMLPVEEARLLKRFSVKQIDPNILLILKKQLQEAFNFFK